MLMGVIDPYSYLRRSARFVRAHRGFDPKHQLERRLHCAFLPDPSRAQADGCTMGQCSIAQ